jgi:hypothetical protein
MKANRSKLVWIISAVIAFGIIVLFHRTIQAALAGDSSDSQSDSSAAANDSFKAQGDTIQVSGDAVGPAGITVAKVEPKDVPMSLTLTGKSALNVDTATHVQPQFAGKIVSITPKLGDIVQGPGEPGGPTILCVILAPGEDSAQDRQRQSGPDARAL